MKFLELRRDGLDGGRALAWMLFPNRPDLRKIHFVRELVEREYMPGAVDDSPLTLPAWMVQSLLNSPGKEEMKDLAADGTKRGTVAGDLLGQIYEMQMMALPEPSFGKAVERYKVFALGLTYGDGEPLKYSEQTLRKYFDEFASVAHLWAAFRLNQGPYAYTDDPRDVFHSSAAFFTFLGIAKAVADFATTFIPKRTKPPRTVIDADVLIHVPDEVSPIRLHFHNNPT